MIVADTDDLRLRIQKEMAYRAGYREPTEREKNRRSIYGQDKLDIYFAGLFN